MDSLLQWGCDVLNAALCFIKTVGITEIRQTMELFTKFTAVLLLALLLAYAIFYMWDTWFPEVRQATSGNGPMTNHHGFSPGYGPRYEPVNTNNRDARTSALFPPFGHNDSLNALQDVSSMTREQQATPAAPNQGIPSRSGNATPIGYQASSANVRPQRRQFRNQFDEFKRHPMERDNQLFRRMIVNEYRLYRPGTATEHQRYSIQRDDPKSRRLPATSEEARQQQNRRFPGRQNANDSGRTRHIPGTSDRSGGADTPHNNTDYRESKRRAVSISSNEIVGVYEMDKVNVETPCNKDSETLSPKPSHCDCDDEDEKSSDGQPANETTTTAIKASGSYPYVIEMVSDSSSENLVTEKAVKSEKKQVMTPKDSDKAINKP